MGIRKNFIEKMTQCQMYIVEFNIKWIDMFDKNETEMDDLNAKLQMLDLPWMDMIPNEPPPPIQEPEFQLSSIIDLPTPSQLMNDMKSKQPSPTAKKVSPTTKKAAKPGKTVIPEEPAAETKNSEEPTIPQGDPPLILPVIGEQTPKEDDKLKLLMMLEPPLKLEDSPRGIPFNSTRSCMFAWGGALQLIHALQRQPLLVRLNKAGKAKPVAQASIWFSSDFYEASAQASLRSTVPAYAYQHGAYDLLDCRPATGKIIGSIIMSIRLSCYGTCAKSNLKSPGGDLMDRVPWLSEYHSPQDFDPTVCPWQPGQECRDVCDLSPAVAAPLLPSLRGAKPEAPRPQVSTGPPTPDSCSVREACTNMIATRFRTKAMLARLEDEKQEDKAGT